MPPLNLMTAYATQNRYGESADLTNMFLETSKSTSGIALRPRFALSLYYTAGGGPIKAILHVSGVAGTATFTISGTSAYKDSTWLGTVVSGYGYTIATSGDEVVFTSGGFVYLYVFETNTFSQIVLPDSVKCNAVVFIAGRFYYNVNSSDRWYFSALYDAATVDALSFATAESNPDQTIGVCVLGDEVWFLGNKTIEPWYVTGDSSAPLQRAQGRVFQKGCGAQYSIAVIDNTLFWLGTDYNIYRASNVPIVISTPAISEKIRTSTRINECSAFRTAFAGHDFYVINIPLVGSYAYDVATQSWSEWASYGEDTLRVSCGTYADSGSLMGSAIDGKVYTWSDSELTDDGDPIEYKFAAYIPTISRGQVLHTLSVKGLFGSSVIGNDDHTIEMRYSDDGITWSGWSQRSLGATGQYATTAVWLRQGLIGSVGRSFEFRTTSPIVFTTNGLTYNERLS